MSKHISLLSSLLLLGFSSWHGASASTYKVLYSFCAKDDCADGQGPRAALVMDGAGTLFGTTENGGRLGANGHRHGTVFALSPNSQRTKWKHRILHTFCAKEGCEDGDEPSASLILDTSGNLYGTTPYGGFEDRGTIFRLSPQPDNGWKYKVLHRFCLQSGCLDGWAPHAGLAYAGQATGEPYDGTSPLYGTTAHGGDFDSSQGGTAFKFTHRQGSDRWHEQVFYSFCSSASCDPSLPNPSSGLTVGADSTLYGTLSNDGFNGDVYALSPKRGGGDWKEKTMHAFCAQANCADGKFPHPDRLALDGDGNLYGTTSSGGAHSAGTIFKLDPHSRTLTTLYDFCSLADCADGKRVETGLLRDASGALYGTTPATDSGAGTVFVLKDGVFQVLHTFCTEANCPDGSGPQAGLIMDGDGVLYGTTAGGGAHGGGTVFALVP